MIVSPGPCSPRWTVAEKLPRQTAIERFDAALVVRGTGPSRRQQRRESQDGVYADVADRHPAATVISTAVRHGGAE
jgi:hypothetical protein